MMLNYYLVIFFPVLNFLARITYKNTFTVGFMATKIKLVVLGCM